MKKIITTSCLLFSVLIKAQVFTGSGGAIQNNGQDTYFPVNVSGLSQANIDSVFGLEQVCFSINHADVSELYIYLQSPAGRIVNLTLGNSTAGANFVSTCLNSSSTSPVTLGSTPYTGTFKPVGYLGRFNTAQAGNGTWNLIVHDGYPLTNAGTLISWSLQFGNAPAHPVVFSSSNLPLVFLTTTQPIGDVKTLAGMGVVDNGASRSNYTDPWNNYNAKVHIQIHGSSTRNFEKKAYGIETADMSGNKLTGPLLGMPLESDWDLIASYQDKTFLRHALTYDLFRSMGHYAPRYKKVELFLNNEYQGIYSVVEKIKRDSNRVHVKTMTTAANSSPAITGGYVFKIDRSDVPGWYSQQPGDCQAGTHFYFQYLYPKASDITIQQQNYIQNYVDSFETVMNSSYWADPLIGYRKYIATSSFIDFFIISELCKNVDAYRLSTYLYKKNIVDGGKMHIGPVWDYDLAWHNCNYGNTFNAGGWQYQVQTNDYPVPTWWGRFMQDSNFVNELYCRYTQLRHSILSINYLNNYIDSSANVLSESQQRNFVQWPIMGAYIYPNPQSQVNANYSAEVNDLKTWVANRIAWLDGAIIGQCQTGIPHPYMHDSFSVFPNPMQSSSTFLLHLTKKADISLCITDVTGKEIARFLNAQATPGESRITFEKNNIPAGIYFYQLQIDAQVKTGKLIIQ